MGVAAHGFVRRAAAAWGLQGTATLLLSWSFIHAPPAFLTLFPKTVCSLQSLPPAHNSNFLPIAEVQSLSVIPSLPLFPPLPGHTQLYQAACKSQGLGYFFPSQI